MPVHTIRTTFSLTVEGKSASVDVDRAYHVGGRKTAAIVGDIVAQSRNREGVLIYAATVQHAQETGGVSRQNYPQWLLLTAKDRVTI